VRVVTGAKPFIDIDAYGGILAYSELLGKQGIASRPVSSSTLNSSVTPTVRSWAAPSLTGYTPAADDTFTLIDITNLDYLDPIIDIDRVDEIIDHHLGFEDFWRAKIGDKAHIELVGAACTLVYERWQRAALLDQMSQLSARTLLSGILDNTLNLRAHITNRRDIEAYQKLLPLADLPSDWTAQYFTECQAGILQDIPRAIDDDFKVLSLPGWTGDVQVGQLSIWDPSQLLGKHLPAITTAMRQKGAHWFMNIISLEEGCSYFLCEDPGLKAWLAELLALNFKQDQARADRMWLRKEIVNQALKREEVQ